MPPTIVQDVASIIATRAEGFLEQYEGSGVINLTSAQTKPNPLTIKLRAGGFICPGPKAVVGCAKKCLCGCSGGTD